MTILKDKNVILTGATSGIGKSLLLRLLNEGANVVFCGRSPQKMELVLNLAAKYDSCKYFSMVFDIADEAKIREFIGVAYQKLTTVDLLINCAGLNTGKSEVIDINLHDLDTMMAVNFKAPLIFMKEVGKKMKQAKEGTIVNILSSVCLFANELNGAYTASKAAIDAVTKIMNKEMREHNVRIVSVYPGGVDTEFRVQSRPDYLDPDEVADIILANLKAAPKAALDDLVFRPMVEKNF